MMLVILASRTFAAPADGVPLQLEVFLNGQPIHLIGSFTMLPGARMAAAAKELKELGLKPPAGAADEDLVPLEEIGGLEYRYEPATQTIDITVDDAQRTKHVVDAIGDANRPVDALTGTGLVLNYSLFGSGSESGDWRLLDVNGLSLSLDGRIFTPAGTLTTTGVLRQFSNIEPSFLPLDIAWTTSDSESLISWRIGDIITGGLPWTRPLRIGGVQVARNFALRPNLVTQPLPSFSGSAVVPSTVDVYIDNARAYSQQVPAGPFEIANIPVVSDGGTARIVIRDAAGRETETMVPLAASTRNLRAGLYDFSLEAGFARRDYGIEAHNFDADPLVSLTARYGFSNALTLESHIEAAPELANIGFGSAWSIVGATRLAAAASSSFHGGAVGAQVYASLETKLNGVDLRASTQRTLGDYADLGTVTVENSPAYGSFPNSLSRFYSAKPAKAIDQLTLGLPLRFDESRIGIAVVHLEAEDSRFSSNLVSASYSRSLFGGASFFATSFVDIEEPDDLGVYAGLSWSLGDRITTSAIVNQTQRGIGIGAEASRAIGPEPGSFGWQARVTEGEGAQQFAAVSYRANRFTTQARVSRFGSDVAATGEVNGALVFTDGSLFASNRIDDAFAVVDAGNPDVTVLVENRRVAVTDDNGKALVTGLRGYQRTKIAIDPMTLPPDAEIAMPEQRVALADRQGTTVRFPVRSGRGSALLVFRDAKGDVLPAGSRGHIEGREDEFAIGYDGQAYVTGLEVANVAVVKLRDGECRASFDFVDDGAIQKLIDPVVCRQ